MNDESAAPDFAMKRAVDVLARMVERSLARPAAAPALDRVVLLFNETISFDVTATKREHVERVLGIAFAYPVRGWHTYCVRGEGASREFLSAFYSGGALASAELYLPVTNRAPPLEPRALGRFRLVPGEICIGMQLASLPDGFGRIPKPEGLGPYAQMYAAAFPGGCAYAMGNGGTIERLAIYRLKEEPASARPA